MVFGSSIPLARKQASPLNQRAVGEEHVAEHLAQFTGEGEQGHVSPNTGAP